VSHRRLLDVGRDDANFAEGAGGFRECAEARAIDAVVVGYEYAHGLIE
jgi:hypothetical protein